MTTPPLAAGTRPGWRVGVEIAGCLALGALTWMITFGILLDEGRPLSGLIAVFLVLDVLLGVAGSIAVPLAHRRPTANLVWLALVAATSWGLPAALLALVRVGSQDRPRWNIAAVAFVVVINFARLSAEEWPLSPWRLENIGLAVAVGLMALAVIGWARARQTKIRLLASLQAEAAAAQRERDALAGRQQAEVHAVRAEERAAIARDMHDTISHQLALVALHAGALGYRTDLTPEQQRTAAATVRDAAAEAGQSLRDVLASLRSDGDLDRAPLPVWTSLPEQVSAARERGDRVQLIMDDDDLSTLHQRSPATSIGLARIVAEVLINAAKHAPGQPLTITVSSAHHGVVLTAVNPLAPAAPTLPPVGTGTGLVGAAERARLLGGRLDRTTSDREHRVDVWLPLPPDPIEPVPVSGSVSGSVHERGESDAGA